MKRSRMPWPQWSEAASRVCLANIGCWPNNEMRRYWGKDMTPLEAYEQACRLRRGMLKDKSKGQP